MSVTAYLNMNYKHNKKMEGKYIVYTKTKLLKCGTTWMKEKQ